MPAQNESLLLAAAREVVRPLRAFIAIEIKSQKFQISVLKSGLSLHAKPLGELSLPAKVASLTKLATWVRNVLHDNLQNGELHAKPQRMAVNQYSPSSFVADKLALADLYRDNFVSAEKKDLVADLDASQGHYIKSSINPALHIFDAASQIASFNLGFNSPKRHSLLLRAEAQTQYGVGETDLEVALVNFLKRKSGLEHVTVLNSGSEANDFALSQCKLKYPRRAKVFAFEGSFHGRTLLALHTTHSPAKREPFEIYKGLVEFFQFPEDHSPHLQAPEPDGWLAHWAAPKESHTNPIFLAWLKQRDGLLSQEIAILDRLRKEFQSGNLPFALIIEPMQCEGGDRYATARFMRALRVLTRAHQVPLIFDEVQTGFGLGGPFFWHELFNLQDAAGNAEYPDAISVAKKAQVGACLSSEAWPRPAGTASLAGLHRGYIQAQAAKEGPEVDDLAPLALRCLEAFAKATVPDWVLNPRGQGFAFAFDLPSPQIAADLIKVRFDNGILIYPAGDRTLRFRLMVSSRRRDLFEMYVALYGCFAAVAKLHNLTLVDDLDVLRIKLRTILTLEDADFSHKYVEVVSRDQVTLPTRCEELAALDEHKWQRVFKTLMRLHPELLGESQLDLAQLKRHTNEDLIAFYHSGEFSWLNLLWELSRKHSFDVTIWTADDIEAFREKIDALQAATYEPVRRASVDSLKEQALDPRTLPLACIERDGSLAGICIAVPLDTASDLPYFLEHPRGVDKLDLYSTDLTVDSEHRSNGLGLRLKVEQLIAARLRGFRRITSRNRYPEAKAMSKLNQKLGAVVCHISHHDYGGSGTGLYQSVEFRAPEHRLEIFQNPSTLLNKMCLSNFVSPAYLNFLEIWRHAIPEDYRHLYLSSGESEALDKWIKTLYSHRPQATHAVSFYGDRFGGGTAAARSLGGVEADPSPFEWPRFHSDRAIEQVKAYFQQNAPSEVLGIFVEPTDGKTWLAELLAFAKSLGVPVIFNESRTMLGRVKSELLFVSGSSSSLKPDGFYAYGGNQIAINAVSESLFIAKPLTMISTWDGDEWSLQIFTESLLRYLESRGE